MTVGALFGRAAWDYDRARRQLVPGFDRFYGAVLESVPFETEEKIRVLDLGAGTGLLSAMVAERFPRSRVTLVDLSVEMLRVARRRFAGEPERFDFRTMDYARKPLPRILGGYDLVVSALSVHHLTHGDKKGLFQRVHGSLAGGGHFINADQISGETPEEETLYSEWWLRRVREAGVSEEDLASALSLMRADRNATLGARLGWLGQVLRGYGVVTKITGSRSTMVERDTRTRRTGRTPMDKPKTLVEKVWEKHVVRSAEEEPDLLYVDLHLVHEVTSPQAFEGLRLAGRGVRRPDLTLATMDHNVPTSEFGMPIRDRVSAKQMEALRQNCEEFGIKLNEWGSIGQGIVHIIGPETGLTQPGLVIVCGDSHTATHGAFGALAFGIGTSEVEHVLATQTLPQSRPKTMAVTVEGELPEDVTAKDLMLGILNRIGTGGGVGHVIEYRGEAVRQLSMEGRMTVCNMSIEGGARAGLIAPDQTTFEYLEGREHAPNGEDWDRAVEEWKRLPTDEGAEFDKEVVIQAEDLVPYVSWGTTPAQTVPLDGEVPEPQSDGHERALKYMALQPGTRIRDIEVDTVFLGSCTNARIEDLRAAASVLEGHKVKEGIRAMVVPGSMRVKKQAEEEGLADIFTDAGFDWRNAGCSMCLGMNPDILQPGERCASTSNRNFEGRQGKGGRTHLVSPAVAAATAVMGRFASPSELGVPVEVS